MKFGKKEKETQEEEVVRGEIQRVVPDYRVGLNPEQIRIREENGWTNDEVAPPGLTTKEIVHNNIFTYFNLSDSGDSAVPGRFFSKSDIPAGHHLQYTDRDHSGDPFQESTG